MPGSAQAAAPAVQTVQPQQGAGGDSGHLPPELAAAGPGKPPAKNKACPCPNCRPPPPATIVKGAGSFSNTVRSGGPVGGGDRASAGANKAPPQAKGGTGKAPPPFNVKALPARPLMAGGTGKDAAKAVQVRARGLMCWGNVPGGHRRALLS